MAAIDHAIPIPRNTLTALEPVTLPTELSAVSSSIAAVLEAKVSAGKCNVRKLSAAYHLVILTNNKTWHVFIFLTGQKCGVESLLNIFQLMTGTVETCCWGQSRKRALAERCEC